MVLFAYSAIALIWYVAEIGTNFDVMQCYCVTSNSVVETFLSICSVDRDLNACSMSTTYRQRPSCQSHFFSAKSVALGDCLGLGYQNIIFYYFGCTGTVNDFRALVAQWIKERARRDPSSSPQVFQIYVLIFSYKLHDFDHN